MREKWHHDEEKAKKQPEEVCGAPSSSALGCSPGELAQLQILLVLLKNGSPALQTLLSGGQGGSARPTQVATAPPASGSTAADKAPAAATPKKETASAGWVPFKPKNRTKKDIGPAVAENPPAR